MKGFLVTIAALIVCLQSGLPILAAQGPAQEITPETVRQSIDRAVSYLKRMQKVDGTWPEYINAPGGVTALCTLALLNAGVPADDESVQKALRKLEALDSDRTYVVALQTMAFCQANPAQYRPLIRRNVGKLTKWQKDSGVNAGSWSYPSGPGDNSNTQFALLALHEAETVAGIAVPPVVWRRAKTYWEGCQNLNGSFGYSRTFGQEGTGSMTVAGIASLIIVNDRFRAPSAKVEGEEILCCQPGEQDDDHLRRAMQWLGRNFSVTGNPGTSDGRWLLYYLYGVERVGRMTNQRYFGRDDPMGTGLAGKHDWYREGAEYLIARRQDRMSGYFTGTGPVEENDKCIATALALLFLSKGRRPVLLAKLQHSVADDWNLHRNDVDNLTRYVEKRWRRELTWQVVDLYQASVEDLLQSPVLYLSGNLNPLPRENVQREKLAQKLRDYIDRGGFLLAEQNGPGDRFDDGFRELMKLVFPEPEYRLRLLEPEHPIWRMEEAVPPDQMRRLEGIDFGCRTSVVYLPPDPPEKPRPSLSCLWELSRPGREEKYADSVQRQVDAGLLLGCNILAYATNRQVMTKEMTVFSPVAAKRPGDQLDRSKVVVARLRHPGGCNAAPRALANLMDFVAERTKTRTQARVDLVSLTDDALFQYHLVMMHGRAAFRLTDVERERLRTYLKRGGMLLADSICTSAAFTESFRREMAEVLPDAKLQPIPPSDPIWSDAYGGFDLKTVTRRDPPPRGATGGPLQATLRRVPPELEGIKLDDRWAVVFSPYDISCALEKHDSVECRGYSRADAARIGLNVILYSLQH